MNIIKDPIMKKTVLVIDDETDLCNLIAHALERDGFEVDYALSLTEASEKLTQHHDIVLLDNILPDGTGLSYLQMHPLEFMNSYVVMITADPNETVKLNAAWEGIHEFVTKPFTLTRIKEMLKGVA
jgi:DNA-binding NtrC family response regulator